MCVKKFLHFCEILPLYKFMLNLFMRLATA